MTTPQPVNVRHETLDDGLLIYLEGDIEFSRTPGLRHELLSLIKPANPQRLIIELSQVAYMDSSGIATIVELFQHQRQADCKLVLCCLQEKVFGMFQIASLDSLFVIVEDLEAARTA